MQSLRSVIRGQANDGARMQVGAVGRGSKSRGSYQPVAPPALLSDPRPSTDG